MTEKQVKMSVKTSPFRKKNVENKEEKKLKRKKKQLKKKKLIIRNLSFKVSKDELTKIFSAFGEVLNVEVPQTKEGKKRGFAFVQFKDTKAQVKAIKELNFQKIHGRPIAIDYCVDKTTYQTKTNSPSTKSSNLDDSKNDEDSNSEDEDESVAPETLESNDVSASEDEGNEEDQKVKDFFKTFDGGEEVHDAEDASDETDNESESNESEEEEEDDKSSTKSGPPMRKKHPEDVTEQKTVFIRNISFKNTEEDLKCVAEEHGPVDYCLFCMDRFTDQFKGTAFVKFKEKESAEKFLRESYIEPGILLDGRKLLCAYALSRDDLSNQQTVPDKEKDKRNLRLLKCGLIMRDSQEAEGVSQSDMAKRAQLEMVKKKKLRNVNFFVSDKRLAVHNLPKNFNDKDVRAIFKKAAGKDAVITEARVMKDFQRTDAQGVPVSRGFAFVSFADHEHALKALTELNNNPSIFTPNKRPIVEFSIENKVALLSQEKRRERIKMQNKKRLEPQPENEEKPAVYNFKRKKPNEFQSRKKPNDIQSQKKIKSNVPQKGVTLAGTDKNKKSKKRQKKHPKGKKEKGNQMNAQERRNLSTLSNKYKEKLLSKIK